MIHVVGYAPNRRNADEVFRGRSGRTLSLLFGVPPQSMGRLALAVNLSPVNIDSGPTLRTMARRIVEQAAATDVFMFCGKRVASAFGLWRVGYLVEAKLPSGHVAIVLPHPSRRNRWWGDPACVLSGTAGVRAFIIKAMLDAQIAPTITDESQESDVE